VLPICRAARDAKRPGITSRGTDSLYRNRTVLATTLNRSYVRTHAPTNADLWRFKSKQGREKPGVAYAAQKPDPRFVRLIRARSDDPFGSLSFTELREVRPMLDLQRADTADGGWEP